MIKPDNYKLSSLPIINYVPVINYPANYQLSKKPANYQLSSLMGKYILFSKKIAFAYKMIL